MKTFIIPKQDKKVKILISQQNITNSSVNKILTIKGPLGELQYTFKNQYIDTKLWRWVLDPNLLSPFLFCQI